MAHTSIEWTDVTWNPTVGCSVISPDCTNCYAMRMAGRLDAMGMEKYQGTTRKTGGRAKWNGVVRLDTSSLEAPLVWKSPKRVFVNSMSDLFHEDLPERDIERVWEVMSETSQHTYQVLTKRPERMQQITLRLGRLPNVWLRTSVETSECLERIEHLRQVDCVVRFVSFEPLIGAVGSPNLKDIHWAIVGGESGPGARPMESAWVDEILTSCRHHRTAFFFKQWGGKQRKRTGCELGGRTYDEFPQDQVSPAE